MYSPHEASPRKRLLVVDDDRHIRKLISTMVEALRLPFVVDEAACGSCALRKLQCNDYGLALIDWRMSPMDGLTLVRMVRANDRLRSLPLVMMSAYGDPDSRLLMRITGADHLLEKPLSLKVFGNVVRRAQEPAGPCEVIDLQRRRRIL